MSLRLYWLKESVSYLRYVSERDFAQVILDKCKELNEREPLP